MKRALGSLSKFFLINISACFLFAGPVYAQTQIASPTAMGRIVTIPNGPHAEHPIPLDLQGIWSWPDCTAGRRIVVLSPQYTLFMREGMRSLGALQSWRQEEDDGYMLYEYKTNNSGPALMKRSNDGLMKIIFVGVHPEAPLVTGWGAISDQTAPEFSRCAKLFDSNLGLGQEEINTAFLLDRAASGCKATTPGTFDKDTACHQTLFDIADSDHNKKLNRNELAQLYRQIAFSFSSSVFCGDSDYPADTRAESEDFANAVLGTGTSIDFTQALSLLKDPQFQDNKNTTIKNFLTNAGSIQILLPFLPKVETPKGCPLTSASEIRDLGTIPLEPPNTP